MANASLLGVTLQLPEGWRGVQAVFIGPEVEHKPTGLISMAKPAAFRDNIAVHVAPAGGSKPQDFIGAMMKVLDHKGTRKEPEPHGNGVRAEIVNEAPGGARIRQIIHGFARGEEVWTLTYSFLEGQGDVKDRRAFLDQVLDSLKFD